MAEDSEMTMEELESEQDGGAAGRSGLQAEEGEATRKGAALSALRFAALFPVRFPSVATLVDLLRP